MERRALVVGLLWDLGLPLAAYYACRAAGIGTAAALVAGGAVGVGRVAWVAAARRRLDGLAAVTAGVLVVLGGASLLIGDPRLVLLKGSIVSGIAGIVLLGSCLAGRPAMYALMRRAVAGDPGKAAEWDRRWTTQPRFRRIMSVVSVVWGAGLLVDAVVRVPLVYLLPPDVATSASTALEVATIALLVGWSLLYRRHRERLAAVADGA
ncbi:VC0807 family protein [Pseudonocardia xinjiangensis]|uniref:VC0807 family protein n=1 Tax=Pseudonocardia xinjiangensis TaxID=75289 RepID=UPI003D92CAB9